MKKLYIPLLQKLTEIYPDSSRLKELYHVEGTVHRGFVGQITSTICFEKPCTELDIHLTYDYAELRYKDDQVPPEDVIKYFKSEENFQNAPLITPQLLQKTIEEVSNMSGYTISEEVARRTLIYDIDLKTEIHSLATLNDEFIGCIHKQLPDRHMIYRGEYASQGCIPQEIFDGVLKVTILVFNVTKDNTRYTLTVSGQ